MSIDLTLSKAHISKIVQSGGFLGSLLSNVAVLLAKLGITAAVSAINVRI